MSNELVSQLRALKLHGMAHTVPELLARARSHAMDVEQVLQALLAGETAEQEVKSLAYQMKAARFPAHRDLAGFDFTQVRIDETLVRSLHGGEFMSSAQNAVLIGGPGTGKTTWLPPSESRLSSAISGGCGSSPRWNWSMHWSRRKLPASKGNSPTRLPMLIW